MYKIRYDKLKNCIYVVVEGSMKMEEANNYVVDFKKAVDSTGPNFKICTDLSKTIAVLPEINDKLNESKAYAKAKGYKKAAFIMSSAVLKMQVKRVFEEEQESLFDNINDAEKFLNS